MASFRTLGIATGAGLAAALLFAASAKGGALALVIVCATPLPIMIATLGFAQSSGLVAAAVGSVVVGALLGPLTGGFFAALVAFPSWWLPYLSLLGRQAPVTSTTPQPAMTWYPVGHVVAWTAALTAAVFLAMGAVTVLHYGGYEKALTALASDMAKALAASEAASVANQAAIMVRLTPLVLAALTFLALCTNLWVAARVVQGSGLLVRPWPSLPEHLRLPRGMALLLIVAGLALFLGGVIGLASGIVFTPLSLAFMLQGLGAAHALTRGLAARRLILLAVYLVSLSLTPSLLALAVLGLVDCLTPLRRRKAVPPSPST